MENLKTQFQDYLKRVLTFTPKKKKKKKKPVETVKSSPALCALVWQGTKGKGGGYAMVEC
jgi:hypothetical protein